jgi:1-deoxy-D-xylulose-5-phosphate synthase
MAIIEKINSPADLKKLTVAEVSELAGEIRSFITECVSVSGGHLASNLGVVELTLAMHYVFDLGRDKLFWDVGHQCYTHKIITGRRESFKKLRSRDGISGFPNPSESPYDQFAVGHAGTAVATAVGMAIGEQHCGNKEKIIALVGDASIVNGLSLEALNNMGLVKRQLLVVLNDNSMAIDATQGSFATYLAKVRLSHTYEDMRATANRLLEHMPLFGKGVEDAINRLKKTVRMSAVSASQLFESMNIPYFGPVDGHDLPALVELFSAMAKLDHPAILHVYTKKGKGFTPADNDPRKFHSTGPFKINGESASVSKSGRSFTDAFGEAMVDLARTDPRIFAITAAMCDGTGLKNFREQFAGRCLDVGIAESVAVDIAAGLAKAGQKPVVCLYSTFLQRTFDQVFQEVSLQNIPVIFAIDRAGFVGQDGATHHGLFDIGFMRMMPNMTVLAPANEAEMKLALKFAVNSSGPVAIRYPRDVVPTAACPELNEPFTLGRSIQLSGPDAPTILVAYGTILSEAIKATAILRTRGIQAGVINARFAKPLDPLFLELLRQGKRVVTIEEHAAATGFGSAILELAAARGFAANVTVLGAPDRFIAQDSRENQIAQCGLTAEKIVETVTTATGRKS